MQPIIDTFIAPLCHDEITILFQDAHLLLIGKPNGLLSLSGKNPLNKDSVHFRLIQDFPMATLVHRLDFGTSGIMIVALNKGVNAAISKQFQNGVISKTYTAILHGNLQHNKGTIEFPLAKDPQHFPLQKICYTTGKPALTHYEVISRNVAKNSTRVVFSPVTGRTHQLRIHSSEFGHPILGCDLYGSDETFLLAPRLMLHATMIEFTHPVLGTRISGVSPCPF